MVRYGFDGRVGGGGQGLGFFFFFCEYAICQSQFTLFSKQTILINSFTNIRFS